MSMTIDSKDILVLSDDIRDHSGFAVNARLVCWALAGEYDVANASLSARMPAQTTVDPPGDSDPELAREIDVYPAPSAQDVQAAGSRDLGAEGMQRLVSQCEPDVVVSLIDVQMCQYLAKLREPMMTQIQLRRPGGSVDAIEAIDRLGNWLDSSDTEANFEWVAQVPIDGRPLPDAWEGFFRDVDHPIAMSEFGREAIVDAYDVDPAVVPHGVEHREIDGASREEFLISSVNRNQFRKQYPRLIEAWGKFYERAGRPEDVRFYIHADYEDDAGWPLERYVDEHDIREVMVPYQGKVTRERLMELYKTTDVFTSATGGEGFGLTAIEAMSQGTPVVITDYTTSEELVVEGEPGPRGSLIEPELMYDEHPKFAAVKRALVDTDAFADELLDYYENRERIECEGANAKEWVHEELGWEQVAQQWADYVDEHVEAV